MNSEFESVLAAVPLPFLILDRELRLCRLTPAAAALLHLSPADLGRRVSRLHFGFDLPELGRLSAQVVEYGVPVQTDIRTGSGHWYSMRLGPYQPVNGRPEGVVAAFIDIHELKQSRDEIITESEATIRALVEAAAQAILAVDASGRIVLVNAAAVLMFGYSRQELLELRLDDLIPERLRQKHTQHSAGWRAVPESRNMGPGWDPVALRKDGSEFPIEVSLSRIRTNGDMLAVAFVSDVTERKRAEVSVLRYQRELQELTARLLSVQEAETKLLARELHDVFSQKLAALGMRISALLKSQSEPPEDLHEKLRTLGRQVNNLAEDIHRMSRQLHPAILDDLGLSAALREECDNFARQTGIPVEFHPGDVPRSLPEGIALCLYRVAQESLRNIGKHAQASEVRVSLRCDRESIVLAIEDVGDGFDLEGVKGKGGLGLISMEERARLVNGVFSIHSQPGLGTRVELRVPLKRTR